MSCVRGEVGVERLLMPRWSRVKARVVAIVMGDVEHERAAKDC